MFAFLDSYSPPPLVLMLLASIPLSCLRSRCRIWRIIDLLGIKTAIVIFMLNCAPDDGATRERAQAAAHPGRPRLRRGLIRDHLEMTFAKGEGCLDPTDIVKEAYRAFI